MSSPTGTDDGAEAPDRGAIVYDLATGCTADDVDVGSRYRATVNGVVDYGVFVDLSEAVSGLVHESNLLGSYDEGDQLIVELGEVRSDGDMSFEEVQLSDYETEHVPHGTAADVDGLADATGDTVVVEGQVVQIKQT